MESGEWRYGQADRDDAAVSREPAGSAKASESDLWGDDPTDGWGSTSSWLPSSRPGPTMYPTPPETEPDRPNTAPTQWQSGTADTPAASSPVWGQPGPWEQTTTGRSRAEGRRPSTEATPWGGFERAAEPLRPAAPALPVLPVPARSDATSPAPSAVLTPAPSAQTRAPAESPVSPTGEGPYRRTGVDSWNRPEPTQRQRITNEDEFAPRRRDPYGEEPAYGPVLGYTAGWYGIPAVLYLVWLITLDGDRQGFVGRQFATSLPWLFAAVVLSLAVAGLLRWAIVGWRALTLSFAAAVIGAGVTTIAHSLAI